MESANNEGLDAWGKHCDTTRFFVEAAHKDRAEDVPPEHFVGEYPVVQSCFNKL